MSSLEVVRYRRCPIKALYWVRHKANSGVLAMVDEQNTYIALQPMTHTPDREQVLRGC